VITLSVVVVLLAAALVGTWLIIYPMLSQQGRMLVRLEAIEERLAEAGVAPQSQTDGKPTRPAELAVGALVPSFCLPDLAARNVTLEDFRGRRVLLVHWNFDCGFCE
jgi:hypothetical protein